MGGIKMIFHKIFEKCEAFFIIFMKIIFNETHFGAKIYF